MDFLHETGFVSIEISDIHDAVVCNTTEMTNEELIAMYENRKESEETWIAERSPEHNKSEEAYVTERSLEHNESETYIEHLLKFS